MKYIIYIIFLTVAFFVSFGYYLKNSGDHATGDKWVGLQYGHGKYAVQQEIIKRFQMHMCTKLFILYQNILADVSVV